MKLDKNFNLQLEENVKLHMELIKLKKDIGKSIKLIHKSLVSGGKVLFCGNGGSAADAQHLTAELLIRLRPRVNRKAIPAMSLAQDTSTLTACGNDYSFSQIFSRPFEAIASEKDILFVISTSGNSQNIIEVLKKSKIKKVKSIGLLGGTGGKSKKYCNVKLLVPSNVTARIQECHIFLGHFILEQVENLLIN
jgi:D-sedoheptulose 7-phosphate isomerase